VKLILTREITSEDFKAGQGGHAKHKGNQLLLAICEANAESYKNAESNQKEAIAIAILIAWKQLGGRYLKRLDQEFWYEVDDKTVRECISQKLRDAAKSSASPKSAEKQERMNIFAEWNSKHANLQIVMEGLKSKAELEGSG